MRKIIMVHCHPQNIFNIELVPNYSMWHVYVCTCTLKTNHYDTYCPPNNKSLVNYLSSIPQSTITSDQYLVGYILFTIA